MHLFSLIIPIGRLEWHPINKLCVKNIQIATFSNICCQSFIASKNL